MMIFVGILITLSGFVISVLSLALNSNAARLAVVVLGLAVSLFGIIGVLNRAYLKNAIWKKG
jgi:predicted nucleic acid-binding protein